jgi:hypothetical protein
VDALHQFRATRLNAPITASRNLERLRNLLRLPGRGMDLAKFGESGPAAEDDSIAYAAHA